MNTRALTYAIVFPGQGSQTVGMLAELGAHHADIKTTFSQASDLLGYDLWQLAQEGPEEKIKQTEFTQPLMYVSGVSLYRLWNNQSSRAPLVLAGHSLGEFCALTASGALDFADGVKLVQARAQLMAGAVDEGQGGMAAILGLDDATVIELCESLTGDRVVEAVNFNGPGQVAISGHVDALENAVSKASEAGAKKAVMLPVSVPNHSSLMIDAGKQLAGLIDKVAFKKPALPVVQNTRAVVPGSVEELLTSLKAHVASPVQWTQVYRRMIDDYCPEVVIELGPGKVLAGLGKRIERSVPVVGVNTVDTLAAALDKIQGSVNA